MCPAWTPPRKCAARQTECRLLATACALALVAFAPPVKAGPAVGQFELKDLDAEPGNLEFQSQNAHSFGQPRRRIMRDTDGDLLFDDNSVARQRHALEMEATLTTFLRMRVGIEFEKERFEDVDDIAFANAFADLKLDEIAVELVAILNPVPENGGIGFGALAEFEHPIQAGDDLNSIVFGPIVEAKYGPWGAIGNLTFVHHFGNGARGGRQPERDQKWDLAYAAQLSYAVSESWLLALEGYGTFDRLGNSGTPGEERAAFGDHDLHRAGPLVYYTFSTGKRHGVSEARGLTGSEDDESGNAKGDDDDGMAVTLGVGMLFSLNDNTPDQTLKWSVEVEF
ncbi:MAG: hypothetical protein APF80_06850 [Alphaproteobacteria bacterium BRH_c36]|nr:MAG: hypothetical protein APF80_06850 [Alphaproteobacteria bacterium BRH_c36]